MVGPWQASRRHRPPQVGWEEEPEIWRAFGQYAPAMSLPEPAVGAGCWFARSDGPAGPAYLEQTATLLTAGSAPGPLQLPPAAPPWDLAPYSGDRTGLVGVVLHPSQGDPGPRALSHWQVPSGAGEQLQPLASGWDSHALGLLLSHLEMWAGPQLRIQAAVGHGACAGWHEPSDAAAAALNQLKADIQRMVCSRSRSAGRPTAASTAAHDASTSPAVGMPSVWDPHGSGAGSSAVMPALGSAYWSQPGQVLWAAAGHHPGVAPPAARRPRRSPPLGDSALAALSGALLAALRGARPPSPHATAAAVPHLEPALGPAAVRELVACWLVGALRRGWLGALWPELVQLAVEQEAASLGVLPQAGLPTLTYAAGMHQGFPRHPGRVPSRRWGEALLAHVASRPLPPPPPPRKPGARRPRVLREGQLSMIVFGHDEKALWARRVGCFMRAMRGVLGDRSLRCRWGGSILDSVVGTFLTQNAADVLSSAAFMNLAAAFPAPRSARFFRTSRAAAGPAAGAASLAAPCSVLPCTGDAGDSVGDRDRDGGAPPAAGEPNWSSSPAPPETIAASGGGRPTVAAAMPGLCCDHHCGRIGDGDDGGSGGWFIPEGEDIVDWEAVRAAPDERVAELIRCRGMHLMLARRIKAFLGAAHAHTQAAAAVGGAAAAACAAAAGGGAASPLASAPPAAEACSGALEGITVADAGPQPDAVGGRGRAAADSKDALRAPWEPSAADPPGGGCAGAAPCADVAAAGPPPRPPGPAISLEWLRDADPAAAQSYLSGIAGLGRKSVACITLLALHRKEFPVDINVARVFARLGWIPIESESRLEQLDAYPQEPEVHKYLHSRLMCFDRGTLYELHYQAITLGKVFCQKRDPNCGCCPLASQCDYAVQGGRRLKVPQYDQEVALHTGQKARTQPAAPAPAPAPAATAPARRQTRLPKRLKGATQPSGAEGAPPWDAEGAPPSADVPSQPGIPVTALMQQAVTEELTPNPLQPAMPPGVLLRAPGMEAPSAGAPSPGAAAGSAATATAAAAQPAGLHGRTWAPFQTGQPLPAGGAWRVSAEAASAAELVEAAGLAVAARQPAAAAQAEGELRRLQVERLVAGLWAQQRRACDGAPGMPGDRSLGAARTPAAASAVSNGAALQSAAMAAAAVNAGACLRLGGAQALAAPAEAPSAVTGPTPPAVEPGQLTQPPGSVGRRGEQADTPIKAAKLACDLAVSTAVGSPDPAAPVGPTAALASASVQGLGPSASPPDRHPVLAQECAGPAAESAPQCSARSPVAGPTTPRGSPRHLAARPPRRTAALHASASIARQLARRAVRPQPQPQPVGGVAVPQELVEAAAAGVGAGSGLRDGCEDSACTEIADVAQATRTAHDAPVALASAPCKEHARGVGVGSACPLAASAPLPTSLLSGQEAPWHPPSVLAEPGATIPSWAPRMVREGERGSGHAEPQRAYTPSEPPAVLPMRRSVPVDGIRGPPARPPAGPEPEGAGGAAGRPPGSSAQPVGSGSTVVPAPASPLPLRVPTRCSARLAHRRPVRYWDSSDEDSHGCGEVDHEMPGAAAGPSPATAGPSSAGRLWAAATKPATQSAKRRLAALERHASHSCVVGGTANMHASRPVQPPLQPDTPPAKTALAAPPAGDAATPASVASGYQPSGAEAARAATRSGAPRAVDEAAQVPGAAAGSAPGGTPAGADAVLGDVAGASAAQKVPASSGAPPTPARQGRRGSKRVRATESAASVALAGEGTASVADGAAARHPGSAAGVGAAVAHSGGGAGPVCAGRAPAAADPGWLQVERILAAARACEFRGMEGAATAGAAGVGAEAGAAGQAGAPPRPGLPAADALPLPSALEVLGLEVADLAAGPAAARQRYRELSVAVHPDKCGHPRAADAFNALTLALAAARRAAAAAAGREADKGCGDEDPLYWIEPDGTIRIPPHAKQPLRATSARGPVAQPTAAADAATDAAAPGSAPMLERVLVAEPTAATGALTVGPCDNRDQGTGGSLGQLLRRGLPGSAPESNRTRRLVTGLEVPHAALRAIAAGLPWPPPGPPAVAADAAGESHGCGRTQEGGLPYVLIFVAPADVQRRRAAPLTPAAAPTAPLPQRKRGFGGGAGSLVESCVPGPLLAADEWDVSGQRPTPSKGPVTEAFARQPNAQEAAAQWRVVAADEVLADLHRLASAAPPVAGAARAADAGPHAPSPAGCAPSRPQRGPPHALQAAGIPQGWQPADGAHARCAASGPPADAHVPGRPADAHVPGRPAESGGAGPTSTDGCQVAALSRRELHAMLLVPCWAALRGAFPLNGTYFQTNELFLADHTARQPLRFQLGHLLAALADPHGLEHWRDTQHGGRDLSAGEWSGCCAAAAAAAAAATNSPQPVGVVPRVEAILPPLRTVYFGHATSGITRDMPAEKVALLFNEGAVCVRSFCLLTGFPRSLPHILAPHAASGGTRKGHGGGAGGGNHRSAQDVDELFDE